MNNTTTVVLEPFLTVDAIGAQFIGLCVGIALLLLYWILLSSRLTGLLVSRVLNTFVLPAGNFISIGALNFNLLHGKAGKKTGRQFSSLVYLPPYKPLAPSPTPPTTCIWAS